MHTQNENKHIHTHTHMCIYMCIRKMKTNKYTQTHMCVYIYAFAK